MTALRAPRTPSPASTDPFAALSLPAMGRTASGRPWRLRPADPRIAEAIVQATGAERVIARALAARGVTSEGALTYLNPTLRAALPDPFVMHDMQKATARLAEAILSGETIGIFGDYDVDGVTAASLLHLYLREIGAPSLVYLPDRIAEGYGPSAEAFRALAAQGANLIVTVDCGAAAHGPIEAAAADGLDVVVFDHHQMDGMGPAGACAIVNPNGPADVSGLGDLSAAGVAFMALVALNRALREAGRFRGAGEPDLRKFLDLVALGLVCDVMPMTGVARVLVAQGLKVLGPRGNAGLAALGTAAGQRRTRTAATTYDLGFILGPRINAAGRIGHARAAFDLLTTDDPEVRVALAERLNALNAERQEIEAGVQEAAIAAIETRGLAQRAAIVVSGESWHPGVVGIVAGRLKDRYHRPVVVIGFEGAEGKGSGRSIEGVNLGAEVAAARAAGLLKSGGGHAMAAGLSISAAQIEPFTEFLNVALDASVNASLAARTLAIDAPIGASAISRVFAEMVERAGPFGPGNAEPVFALCDVTPRAIRVAGQGHLACTLRSETGEQAAAIAFRAEGEALGEFLRAGRRLHVAGKIRRDDWRGGEAGQFQIVDAAFAE